MTIHATFESGVFRPVEPIDLPERCEVAFEPRWMEADVAAQIAEMRKTDPGLAAVYEILSRRFESGQRDLADRHNEHNP